jgi:hypothetical protein
MSDSEHKVPFTLKYDCPNCGAKATINASWLPCGGCWAGILNLNIVPGKEGLKTVGWVSNLAADTPSAKPATIEAMLREEFDAIHKALMADIRDNVNDAGYAGMREVVVRWSRLLGMTCKLANEIGYADDE